MVWAYSDTDPPEYGIDAGAEEASGGDLFASLPPGVRTGSRSLHLYESTKLRGLRAQTDSLKWTVASNSVVLPPKDTLYWCTMLKLPTLPGTSSNKKTLLKNSRLFQSPISKCNKNHGERVRKRISKIIFNL